MNTHIRMVPWRVETGLSPHDVLTKRCEEVRRTGGWMSHTLYPGETLQDASGLPPIQHMIRMPTEEVETGLKYVKDGQGNLAIKIFVGGGVSYSFPSDPKNQHLAPFIVELRRPGVAIRVTDCPIPASELTLGTLFSGGLGYPD